MRYLQCVENSCARGAYRIESLSADERRSMMRHVANSTFYAGTALSDVGNIIPRRRSDQWLISRASRELTAYMEWSSLLEKCRLPFNNREGQHEAVRESAETSLAVVYRLFIASRDDGIPFGMALPARVASKKDRLAINSAFTSLPTNLD